MHHFIVGHFYVISELLAAQRFSARVPHVIVTGSQEIAEYREEFHTSLEISRQFLSGNWQYWIYLPALPTLSLFCLSFHWLGFLQMWKIILGVPSLKKVRVIPLHSVSATGVEKWQRFKRRWIANCLRFTSFPKRCTFCKWRALRNDERFQATALHTV